MKQRSETFNDAPQKRVQHDSDKLMFNYAIRVAEPTFGADQIYR